ncbi:hypothetical protein VNO78_14741 [Psophocarpus tetragonolobus]|uniref:Uncharacterized protein n=1 Tax=Psophocarpus tetragonolobus TaxID=3891 RepID=A0AAN9SEM9_PSOTE
MMASDSFSMIHLSYNQPMSGFQGVQFTWHASIGKRENPCNDESRSSRWHRLVLTLRSPPFRVFQPMGNVLGAYLKGLAAKANKDVFKYRIIYDNLDRVRALREKHVFTQDGIKDNIVCKVNPFCDSLGKGYDTIHEKDEDIVEPEGIFHQELKVVAMTPKARLEPKCEAQGCSLFCSSLFTSDKCSRAEMPTDESTELGVQIFSCQVIPKAQNENVDCSTVTEDKK